MNTFIKVGIGAVCGFVAGWASRYLFKEKLQKPGFEVCDDAEQLAYAIQCEAKEQKKAAKGKIDEVFDQGKEEEKEDQKDIPSETPAVKAINTQKTNYMRYFNDGGKYDRHSNLPEGEEAVVSEEGFDKEFISAIENSEEDEIENGEPVDNNEPIPEIEDSSLQEYYHWCSKPDGEYDTETMAWYEHDDKLVVTDEEGDHVTPDPVKYCGFDPKTMFENKSTVDEDPDSLYKKNNRFKTVYEVIRYKASYNVMRRMEEFGGDE